MSEWKTYQPSVVQESEFREIAMDFGDPLEVFREAISNACDVNAKNLWITCKTEQIEGREVLIISIRDDGRGMGDAELQWFWNLGRDKDRKKGDSEIGEKGHGTKIYLRSEKIEVTTKRDGRALESICERPFAALDNGRVHQPKVRELDPANIPNGTEIKLFGYHGNDFKVFHQDYISNYINWYTKSGAFEGEFEGHVRPNISVHLRALDGGGEYEDLISGHEFAPLSETLNKLFGTYQEKATEYYVKKWVRTGTLPNHPQISYQAVIYIEGDQAKRKYNKMLSRPGFRKYGAYKVRDRYGIYLAKDFIPVQQVNEWVSFGGGSNSVVLLHGFINCQSLKLTANRGSIANTNSAVLEDLKLIVKEMLDEIDAHLTEVSFFTIKEWDVEDRTRKVEEADYKTRKRRLDNGKTQLLKREGFADQVVVEPINEAETFGLLMRVYAMHPELFPFEPLDYNTTRGIDLIVRKKTHVPVSESELVYLELKHKLGKRFNHMFVNLGFIVCWDFEGLRDGAEVNSTIGESREVRFGKGDDGLPVYYLEAKGVDGRRIPIIRLKEHLKNYLAISFEE
ncbi:MAG TPA: ATP-binding protein [Gammaproteobacteria bacterium]|nr:ATP-binding protein [Gammaproteobacteria bacterium]